MQIVFTFTLIFLCFNQTQARLVIPTQLSSTDRERAVEVLGFGSSMKILGDPFPLGGYSGVEIGITSEVMSTSEIARLGSKSVQQSETNYSVLTFGKGLYNNIDAYLQFNFLGNDENITNYGGQLRWGIYQAEYLPAYLNLILSGNTVNFQNKISTNTQCADLVSGVTVDDITVYVGGGLVRSQGLFVGGVNGVTDDNDTHKQNSSAQHYVAGVNLKFSEVFVAMQIDRYVQSAYSIKLGVRF